MFKIGDKVQVNPEWWKDNFNSNYGIYEWEDYVGIIFTIESIYRGDYCFKEEPIYFWPEYMLMPVKKTITVAELLRERGCLK